MMRAIAFCLILSTLVSAQEFPEVFSSAGDDVYKSMGKYQKIKNLGIYADRPEFIESFCKDANMSMQKGYALDEMQKDPEAAIDKVMIKSYARELRQLAEQNEAIEHQLREDVCKLYEKKDFQSLAVMQDAEIELTQEIRQAIRAYNKQKKQEQAQALVLAKSKQADIKKPTTKKTEEPKSISPKAVLKAEKKQQKEAPAAVLPPVPATPVKVAEIEPSPPIEKADHEILSEPVKVASIQKSEPVPSPIPALPQKKKVLTKLEYYEQNLARLKEELYELRESDDQDKMGCLNDITAMNYWMISLLNNERDACGTRDAIKQMKSYDKSSLNSCGRDSIRYIEWHGRIKPYVGRKLFEAEAACSR